MIGNDIVDLNLAKIQSNWRRKGFLDKIFTEKEQKYIKNAKSSFVAVWLLWSMKESAYKIFSKQNNIRFFAPKKLQCDITNLQHTVNIGETIYFTSSTTTKSHIHTVATSTIDDLYTSKIFSLTNKTYKNQHHSTYENLKSAIADRFNIPISKLKVVKDANGVPYIKCLKVTSSGVERSLISLSHHGHFGAYAFAV